MLPSRLRGICAEESLRVALAGVEGLEPPASGFGDRRSSQLSYTPAPRLKSAHYGIRSRRRRRKSAAEGVSRPQHPPTTSVARKSAAAHHASTTPSVFCTGSLTR